MEHSWRGGESLGSDSEKARQALCRQWHLSRAPNKQTHPSSEKQQVQRSWGSHELGILEGQGESSMTGAQGVRGAWKGSEGQITPWTALLAMRGHLRKMMGLVMGSSVWNPGTEAERSRETREESVRWSGET